MTQALLNNLIYIRGRDARGVYQGRGLCAVLGAGVVGLQMVYRAGQREKSDGHLRKRPG